MSSTRGVSRKKAEVKRRRRGMEVSGYVVLLGSVVVARILNERGYRQLNDAQKLRLMNGFSAMRTYSLIPLLLLIGALCGLSSLPKVEWNLLAIGYFGGHITYIVVLAVYNHRRMLSLEMPENYRRTFTLSRIISFGGFAWFFFAFLFL